jgi:hypothetical protein
LTGVLIAGLQGWPVVAPDGTRTTMANRILDVVGVHGWERLGTTADIIGVAAFAFLCWTLVRSARQKLEA